MIVVALALAAQAGAGAGAGRAGEPVVDAYYRMILAENVFARCSPALVGFMTVDQTVVPANRRRASAIFDRIRAVRADFERRGWSALRDKAIDRWQQQPGPLFHCRSFDESLADVTATLPPLEAAVERLTDDKRE